MDNNISINPGRLRHKITIKVRPTTQNSYGEEITDITQWDDFKPCYAAIAPENGRVFYSAQQFNSAVSTVFQIRFFRGVTTSMKVIYGSRIFNILAAPDIEERHIERQLWCEEVFMNA